MKQLDFSQEMITDLLFATLLMKPNRFAVTDKKFEMIVVGCLRPNEIPDMPKMKIKAKGSFRLVKFPF